MKKQLKSFYHSFPLQLFLLHFSSNLLLLGAWVILYMLMTGSLARSLGIKYLFLAPEYLGEVDFLSFFLLGFGFGGFYMTWNLTTYLLESSRYPFLATLSRPFTKFCLNNLFLPLVFLGFYLYHSIYFQLYYELRNVEIVIYNCAGFLSGALFLILASVMYFHFTNKDVLTFLKIKDGGDPPKPRIVTDKSEAEVEMIKRDEQKHRVHTYLSESLKARVVRGVAHYDKAILERVFKQNHINALIVQLFSLVLLVVLGYMIDNEYFTIPAGASIFILMSILVAIIGSLTYWFNQWRILVIIGLLWSINFLTSRDILIYKNKGFGLDYESEPAAYSYSTLEAISNPAFVQQDKNETVKILENWKEKNSLTTRKKPKIVMVCVTGGGLRAALWAMHVTQKADSLTQGKLLSQTALITGSSGGIIGMSYLRELYLRQQLTDSISLYDPIHIDRLSKDILNAISFTLVSNDMFLPWARFESGGYTYRKDRGYIFEKQLNKNTEGIMDKPIIAYKKPEQEALIPLLFITPSIINDGRRLVISPHGVSYMMIAPIGIEQPSAVEVDAIDFGRLFENNNPYNLGFLSALRMNASYPYVLPNVYLPSEPGIEVMDAGFRDNYGIMSATRFIHVFKDWILNHTSGVVLLQIRGRDKFSDLSSEKQGVIESILNPLGVAGQLTDLQEFEHDSNLGYIFDLLGKENFHIVRFTYSPSKDNERASVTFHLTEREKSDILQAFHLPRNQESLRQLMELLSH